MPDTGNISYEQLLEDYKQLQLRVTRFSATEQELINTRDRLDMELELYKRLQKYSNKALQCEQKNELCGLITEAIVDLLEVECGMLYYHDRKNPEQSQIFIEGHDFSESLHPLGGELVLLAQNQESPVNIFTTQQLNGFRLLSDFSAAILRMYTDKHEAYELYFLGAITKKNERSYNSITERQINIFGVFSDQMQSVLANQKRNEIIENQIQQIRKSEIELRKLSLIATKTKSGVIITDAFGRIEWVNDAFTDISGYTLDEVVGKKPKDFLQGPETTAEKKQLLSSALSEKKGVETVIINHNKKGQPYYNQLEIIPVFDENDQHINFIAIQKDITEEVRHHFDIVKINKRFELTTSFSNIGIWDRDMVTEQVSCNDMLYNIFSINKGTPTEQFYDIWLSSILPEDKERVLINISNAARGLHKNIKQEYRIIRKSDNTVRNIQSIVISETDEKGNPIRLIGSTQDITELKKIQTDVLKKNEELEKINHELDHFVYSVSHDLRSPLLAIKGIVDLVLKSKELNEENRKLLNMTLKSATKLDYTIQEILDYSRNSRVELQISSVNLQEMVQAVYDELKYSSEMPVHLNFHITSEPVVQTDAIRLGVVIKNIIGNSIKYRKKNCETIIDISINRSGDKTKIKIEDNGQGIDEKHLLRVFDMFYRANTSSVGTGLGLYICREIMAKLGGTIQIESVINKGTAVTIEF